MDCHHAYRRYASCGDSMTYAWLLAPHEYEPDYNAYWRDLESLEEAMADVASYQDWFVEYE